MTALSTIDTSQRVQSLIGQPGSNQIIYQIAPGSYGLVALGLNLTLTNGTLNVAGGGSDASTLNGQPGSYYTNASNLSAGTIPSARLGTIPWSNIGSTPTTLGGYGITDGARSGANTDITSITGSAAKLTTGRTIALTGDATGTSAAFDGSANASIPLTLATVNANTGTFGSASQIPVVTFDGKGRATAVTTVAVPPGNSGTVTSVSGIAPIVSDGDTVHPMLSINPATTSSPGSLAAADKVKLNALSGTNTGDQTITLTNDVTGSGTGSFAATLATVNSNTGTFGSATQIPVITFDGKGRATAVTTVAVSGGGGGGSGTVTNFSSTGANGIIANVTNPTTTPALALSLGAITPTTVTPTGLITAVASAAGGAGLNIAPGAAPTTPNNGDVWLTSSLIGVQIGGTTQTLAFLTSNVASATKLVTARTINGVGFDGTANITINAVDSTARLAVANALSELTGSAATARGNISAAASGANTDITSITGSAAKWTTSRTIAATGDIAYTSGALDGSANVTGAATIQPNVVDNTKLAQVANATFKGRTSAGTGNPEDMTPAQAAALLPVFGTAKGLVPAVASSSGQFLRDDGTFATPSGGGGGGFYAYHPVPPAPSGLILTAALNSASPAANTPSANRTIFVPYQPSKTIVITALSINVTTAVASSTATLCIYADSGSGVPGNQLEAGSVSSAATGLQTYTLPTPRTLTAGTLYWVACYCSSSGVAGTCYSVNALLPIGSTTISNSMQYYIRYSTGAPASPAGTTNLSASGVIIVGMTVQ